MAETKTFKCHKCGALHLAEKDDKGKVKISLYHEEKEEDEEDNGKGNKGKKREEGEEFPDIFG